MAWAPLCWDPGAPAGPVGCPPSPRPEPAGPALLAPPPRAGDPALCLRGADLQPDARVRGGGPRTAAEKGGRWAAVLSLGTGDVCECGPTPPDTHLPSAPAPQRRGPSPRGALSGPWRVRWARRPGSPSNPRCVEDRPGPRGRFQTGVLGGGVGGQCWSSRWKPEGPRGLAWMITVHLDPPGPRPGFFFSLFFFFCFLLLSFF